MADDQSIAEAKSEAFREYAKQFFDASVAAVQAQKLEPHGVPAFELPGDARLERLPDGSFKWTVSAEPAVDEYVQKRLAELGATNDPKQVY